MGDKQARGSWLAAALVIAVAALAMYGYTVSRGTPSRSAAATIGRQIPGQDVPPERLKKATFGAGCFWGVEATFRKVPGVVATDVGYLGGTMKNPTYKDVCTGRTGHAEVVQVTYDAAAVSYRALLDVFWANHDPTTLDRQGPDVGRQYRSAIFYHDRTQRDVALASKQAAQRSGRFRRPIVTEITPASAFYRAEEYHQQYLEKRGLAFCHTPSG